jgi:hypothetical protein
VLRAAGETVATQENIQDWLELYEGDPGFQLLTEEEIAAVIFLFIFVSTAITSKFSIHLSFRAIFCFIKSDYRLIRMTSLPTSLQSETDRNSTETAHVPLI